MNRFSKNFTIGLAATVIMFPIIQGETLAVGSSGHSSGSHSSSHSSSTSSAKSTSSSSAQVASRINSMSRLNTTSRMNQSSKVQANAQRATVNSLLKPTAKQVGNTKQLKTAQTQYYNHFLYYGHSYHHYSTNEQLQILKQLSSQTVYVIYVKHNGVRRMYAVSESLYSQINKGDQVHIENGKVTLKKHV
ncbi:hypothetical protein [Macrococcus sp. DPC7161]|uniref:hypothetical protein n=1 Tax=Macrococcus sp. DPC7161 TaxID=2507060 RepID=UPI00100A9E6C|nr:hypothetical protein [Macrococcus sp. DPC7161]RXK19030.1 hypothetical protein ER639_01585 [Macrococcus sp. DPC7161]